MEGPTAGDVRDENERIEERVEGQVKAELEPTTKGAEGESWAEIARRIEARIRSDMAAWMGVHGNASWSEIGQNLEARTKQTFGGWAGATAADDWDTVGRKIEARTRERAARWSGVEAPEQADWETIGRRVDARARSGLGSWVGAAPDADWRTVAATYRTRISADLEKRFPKRPRPAQGEEGTVERTPSGGESVRWEEIKVRGSELLAEFERLVHEGNVRRVVIKQDSRVIAEFPLTVGVVGVLLAPALAAVGAIAALVADCTIAVERVAPPAS